MKVTFGLDATSRSYDNAQKGEPRDWEPRADLTASTIPIPLVMSLSDQITLLQIHKRTYISLILQLKREIINAIPACRNKERNTQLSLRYN